MHVNSAFQTTARRDTKAFLSDQCKEIEENNRMGKTRYLFKKIRDTTGIFHARMGTIKDRNGMDLTETENIKKRWQQYTQELYKRDLQASLSIHHQNLEFAQTLASQVDYAIQPSHPLPSPSPPAFNLSYYQGLFQ